MSATIARQRGWVQLEQSDMRLALNMAKMSKGGFLGTTIEQTESLMKKSLAEEWEEKEWGVQLPGHNNGEAEMEIHLARRRENPTDGCPHCEPGTAQNPQTGWRRKGTGTPPPERLREQTPEPMPDSPGIPPVPPGDKEGDHASDIAGVPPRYVYLHTPLPSTQYFNYDAYAKDCKRGKAFNPDLLTDKATFTGSYTNGRMLIQLTSILKTTAAYWANLTVMTSIDGMETDFWVYYYLQSADTWKYILKDTFLCIIKEQCSDEGESTWSRYKGCQNTINDIPCQL